MGEYQKHVRGEVEYGIAGIPDVVASMSTRKDKKGREVAYQGESYIMMVRFTNDGPIIETVNAYGASNRADSPHFTDQMELFVNQRLKPMSLSREDVQKNAERVYHPMK